VAVGDEDALLTYGVLVGQRLRLVRQQRRMTLQEVDQLTGGEIKASVLGAYERGERIISVLRLKRLSEFYRVPIDHLLPHPDQAEPEAQIDLVDWPPAQTDRRRAAREAVRKPIASGRWPRRCSRR
jgi:transcriptional regulator with XRE-family HTH domain